MAPIVKILFHRNSERTVENVNFNGILEGEINNQATNPVVWAVIRQMVKQNDKIIICKIQEEKVIYKK